MAATPAAAPAPEVPPRQMSAAARLFGIFWEPKRTFQDIVHHPSFVLPLILMMVFGLVLMTLFTDKVGAEAFLEQQMARNPNAQEVPPAQLGVIAKVTTAMFFGGALLGPPAMVALTALVLMFAFRIMAGSQATYKQSFGITAHAFLPSLISSALASIVLLTVHPSDFDLTNPIMSNLGWLFDLESTELWLYTLASKIDLFSFWIVILLAMGFATATKKCSTGTGVAIVGCLWAIITVVSVGWTALVG